MNFFAIIFFHLFCNSSSILLDEIESQFQTGNRLLSDHDFYFPTKDPWQKVQPTEANCNAKELEKAIEFAGKNKSKGVVVLWKGRILAERYWNWDKDRPHPAYSVSKSLVSTLVGIAIDKKMIEGVEQPASDFLEEWSGKAEHQKIALHDLLSMSGGLTGGRRVFRQGILARDERAFATSLAVQHPPGAHWEYHNSAYRLLFPILETASKKSLTEFSEDVLFEPLGMKHTRWSTKRFNRDQYTFLRMTPRDAARFGLLVLADGQWDGKQVVSEDWLGRATKAANPKLNPSYGYLWWLNGGKHFYLPVNPRKNKGPIFPSCPQDAFAALGKDDQKIYVVPSLKLVVTRFGDSTKATTPALSSFDDQFLGRICGAFRSSTNEEDR